MVNLTPHQIDIVLPSGSTVSIPPSGTVARIETIDEPAGSIMLPDGRVIPVTRTRYGALTGLDDLPEGEMAVVSRLVLDAARAAGHPAADRLLAPGPLVRDAEGRVVGCRGLAR